MHNEPSIVKILREEERLGLLITPSLDHCEILQKSEVTAEDSSPDSLILVTEKNEHSLQGITTETLDIINEHIFETAAFAVLVVDPQGKIISWNTKTKRILGETDETIFLKSITTFFPLDEWKKIKLFTKNQSKLQHHLETKIFSSQNRKLNVRTSLNVLKNTDDQLLGFLFIFQDITEIAQYKKAIKTLSENEKKFRVLLENSLDMIYHYNIPKKTCDYVSPSSIKVIGYPSKEMTSFSLQKIEELIFPEDRDRWNQHFKTITDYEKRRGTFGAIEYRIKHKSIGYRWISDTCSAIFDEKHNPVSVVGTIEDITDRKKVWDELVKSEEKYRILAETSADGVFTTDALGRLTYVNPSFEKLSGRRKSQILATPFRNYLLEESIYFFQQIFIEVRKKNEKIENVELDLVDGNGGIIPIEANIAPFQKDADFGGVVCTIRDITQRREIEDELKKNERLKTEFMNIAAHELRSPVTPIKGYLDLIIHDNDSSDKIKNWAKISLRNAERLLKLVNDILDVARLDSDTMRFEMEKIDPVELLNEIAEDMRPAILNKKLEFRLNIPATLPHIIGDKIRLSQVLKNLIGNALKFTDSGFIGINAEKRDGHLVITVEDTGIGISKDELRKIFTKFYQAYTGEDRNNEGTGLGLFISKEIMKKHNGTIWAESDIGKGSRFVIQLPYIYKMTVDFKT